MNILKEVKTAIEIERDALTHLLQNVDEEVIRAIETIFECKGRLIITGMGKAGIIGKKIAATFSSTGTPAFYLHPAEALHGDLGIVTNNDVVMIFSNSGATEEVLRLLPYFKRNNIKLIALTGNLKSELAVQSNVVLNVNVSREADPLGIAPTASTTTMLALGDALAVALIIKRGFTKEEFSIFHPNGSLGKKLLLRVDDLMHKDEQIPIVKDGVTVREAIWEMSTKRLGVTFIVDGRNHLSGIFTDGDLRRLMQRESNPLDFFIKDVMKTNPKSIDGSILAAKALKRMEENSITVLPVINYKNEPIGAIHLHDLVKAGLV